MISLKKTMETQREELLARSLETYRSTIAAIAASGEQVCPSLGDEFQQSLLALRERISSLASPSAVEETGKEIDQRLEGWGVSVAGYYKQKAAEIQDMVLDIAEVAKAVAARDDRYKAQFGEVTLRLHKVNDLEDLVRIRELVGETAAALKSCVERMVEDGRQSLASLQNKLAHYEQRLSEAERKSLLDPMTLLANRKGVEMEAEARVQAGAEFCLVVIDLNGFKKINDTYGHPAGDEILKLFAAEMKSQFRDRDVVGRWGGDEFVALLDCSRREAESRIQTVRKWVFGDYPLTTAGRKTKVALTGAVGVAVWSRGKTVEQMFAEADQAMFRDKAGSAR